MSFTPLGRGVAEVHQLRAELRRLERRLEVERLLRRQALTIGAALVGTVAFNVLLVLTVTG